MIKRPVTYDVRDGSLMDADRNVIGHPFVRVGRLDKELHDIGRELAECVNAFIPGEKAVIGLVPSGEGQVEAEKPSNKALPPAKVTVEPKRRGRPSKN